MRLPFTVHDFFDVFRRYNDGVWPAQLLLAALGVAAILLVLRSGGKASRIVSGVLGLLWLWMGGVYHIAFFRPINPAAMLFGIAFIAQGVAFLWLGVRREGLTFGVGRDAAAMAGAMMLLYALVIYPLLGHALGHRYPAAPTFGVPCPTTIFTFGLLMWTRPRVPRMLLVVPALWALIGTTAAVQLGVLEDFGLLLAAVVAIPWLLVRDRHPAISAARARAA